jgi:hypothetical protein
MIAGKKTRELAWPTSDRFPDHGAVWPRHRFDTHLIDVAIESGADVRFECEALPELEGDRVVGVRAGGERGGSPHHPGRRRAGAAAKMLGAERDPDEPFGLAIRAYAPTPRHAERHLEACLSLRDEHGTPVPGYGWMFPAGDGTVNIGVGALSTMKGFKQLNLNRLLDQYAAIVREPWGLGEYLDKPRAWRLPMSSVRGQRAGLGGHRRRRRLRQPDERRGHRLRPGERHARRGAVPRQPGHAPGHYDQLVGERFDSFLRTGRRFSFLIGHPWLLKPGLRIAVGTQAAADITLAVMGNLIDSATRPARRARVMRLADTTLRWADPLLRRTRAAA